MYKHVYVYVHGYIYMHISCISTITDRLISFGPRSSARTLLASGFWTPSRSDVATIGRCKMTGPLYGNYMGLKGATTS